MIHESTKDFIKRWACLAVLLVIAAAGIYTAYRLVLKALATTFKAQHQGADRTDNR
jgi:hypothetical protein